MQPQNVGPDTASPTPQFDFILRDPPPVPQKSGFKLPSSKLKIVLGVLGLVALIFIYVIINSVLSSSKNAAIQQLISADARAQEIVRVSTVAASLTTDPLTQNLIATTNTVLGSEQAAIAPHLGKVKATALGIFVDKTADAELQSSVQSNSLPATYDAYLKKNLALYESDLKTAANSPLKADTKLLLANFQLNVQVLLAAPEVASASGS